MAISSDTYYNAVPAINVGTYVLTFSKANATDTIDVATYTPIKTILFAKAQVDAAGADDPLTWSGTSITFSTGTGAGRVLVVGKC